MLRSMLWAWHWRTPACSRPRLRPCILFGPMTVKSRCGIGISSASHRKKSRLQPLAPFWNGWMISLPPKPNLTVSDISFHGTDWANCVDRGFNLTMHFWKVPYSLWVGIPQLAIDCCLCNHFTKVFWKIQFIPLSALSVLEDIQWEFGHCRLAH